MARGRGFTHEEHLVAGPGVPLAIVLSHRVWTELFGSDPNVLGKSLRFAEASNVTTTVVGVAPQDLDLPHGTDFWYGARINPQNVAHSLAGVLRVRPGTRLERVRAELAQVMAGVARDFPASDTAREYVVQPLVTSMVGDLGPTLRDRARGGRCSLDGS